MAKMTIGKKIIAVALVAVMIVAALVFLANPAESKGDGTATIYLIGDDGRVYSADVDLSDLTNAETAQMALGGARQTMFKPLDTTGGYTGNLISVDRYMKYALGMKATGTIDFDNLASLTYLRGTFTGKLASGWDMQFCARGATGNTAYPKSYVCDAWTYNAATNTHSAVTKDSTTWEIDSYYSMNGVTKAAGLFGGATNGVSAGPLLGLDLDGAKLTLTLNAQGDVGGGAYNMPAYFVTLTLKCNWAEPAITVAVTGMGYSA